jgi:hypothetical protein
LLPKKQPSPLSKYSGVGFQMLLPILLGVWGGKKLDASYGTGQVWTIILSLFGVFSGMYLAIKQLIKPDVNDENTASGKSDSEKK